MTVELKLELNEQAIQQLRRIPVLLRLGPAERTLKAMAKPIVDRAKAIAPSSVKSGSRKKWGKNKTAKFDPSSWAKNEARNNIGFVYRKGENGGYLVIGGKSPNANSLNFDAGKRRRVFYWGKDAGRTKRVEPSERFMQKALDQTKSAQESAGFRQLEKELKELKLG
jgi:hypothetical protein